MGSLIKEYDFTNMTINYMKIWIIHHVFMPPNFLSQNNSLNISTIQYNILQQFRPSICHIIVVINSKVDEYYKVITKL